jgi:hypothetical protein
MQNAESRNRLNIGRDAPATIQGVSGFDILHSAFCIRVARSNSDAYA